MPDSLGARLRRKREEQQIALEAIAADTKIKLTLLEALERDDLSGWPSGIFRRGYVRAYARAIGLPPDAVVNEFVALYPDPDESDTLLSAGLPKSAEPESWRDRIWQFGRRAAQTDVLAASGSPAPALKPPAFIGAESAAAEPTVTDDAVPAVEATPRVEESAPTVAVVAAEPPAAREFVPDLAATAALCTELGRIADASDLTRVLESTAALLNASGLIVWIWEPAANALVPAFTHGYSPRVLRHLEPIAHDSDNATAAAFRSAELCTVKRTDRQNGALAAPLLRAAGCIGVFAIEVADGAEQTQAVSQVVRIVAAQLATLFDVPAPADSTADESPQQLLVSDEQASTG